MSTAPPGETTDPKLTNATLVADEDQPHFLVQVVVAAAPPRHHLDQATLVLGPVVVHDHEPHGLPGSGPGGGHPGLGLVGAAPPLGEEGHWRRISNFNERGR